MSDPEFLPILCALGGFLLCLGAELLHTLRIRRVAQLAFGPGEKPAMWTRAVPLLKSVAVGALAWGLMTLILIEPKKHSSDQERELASDEFRHVLMVLDVSPSMRLVDAGPTKGAMQPPSSSILTRPKEGRGRPRMDPSVSK